MRGVIDSMRINYYDRGIAVNIALTLRATAVAIGALVAIGASCAFAQQASTEMPAAGCFIQPARLADNELSSFLTQPGSLLAQYASGGLPLANRVRSLAGSSSDALSPILALVTPTTPENQVSAIGAGLGRAARACAASNLAYATKIQELVAATNNTVLTVAFLAGSGEVQTAALGAASASGGGAGTGAAGIGNGGVAGGGSAGLDGSESVAQTSSNFDGTGSGRFFITSVSP